MQNAIELVFGIEYGVQTHGNSIQLDCVDQALTGKCIQYHNDQWLFFIPSNDTNLFLNIIYEDCRDNRGIQVVIFQGELCAPDTYEIISCTSLENRENFYISLEELKVGKKYWINVDGYLNDYCKINLLLDDSPQGIASTVREFIDAEMNIIKDSLKISWSIPDTVAYVLSHFQIKGGYFDKNQNIIKDEILVISDAHGHFQLEYSFMTKLDTSFRYKNILLIGKFADQRTEILKEFKVPKIDLSNKFDMNQLISFPIEISRTGFYTVEVFDAINKRLIVSKVIDFDKEVEKNFTYNYVSNNQKRIQRIRVRIINNRTKYVRTRYYDL